MKEVVTRTWCDNHRLEGQDGVEGSITREITVERGADPREVDVCPDCDELLFGPIVKLMQGARRTEASLIKPKVQAAAPSDGWQCRICPDPYPYTTKQSLLMHIWHDHAHLEKPPQPGRCPDCGIHHDRPVGMARHRASQHGWDALDEAYNAIPRRK